MNPAINWAKCTVNIPNHTDRTPDYNQKNKFVQETTTNAPTHANLLPREYVREMPTYPDRKFTTVKVCKTTIATELTREAGMSEVKLPEWYQELSSAFSEEEAHHFPPS